ncbi:ribonuclease T2 family protein [Oxalobacteraceae bacterium A2-2]
MRRTTLALLFALACAQAAASESASGSFTATQSCEAYNSFAKHSNPGDVKVTAGTSYTVREINKPDYDWVRIDVPGAEPRLRWVQKQCGKPELGASGAVAADEKGKSCSVANQQDSYVLAVTWQPGFCEHARYDGKKPECEAVNSGKLQVKTLSLHGLWPNKKECGISYGNCKGPDLNLRPETVEKLAPWMPNFFYERSFGNYEWKKHGTCQALPQDDYFLKAVDAVRVVNDSEVGKLVLSHTGKSINVDEFFSRVKARYGDTVAGSITLVCTQRKYLQEIRVSLPLNFSTSGELTQLVAGGSGQASPRQLGCADEIYVEAPGPL